MAIAIVNIKFYQCLTWAEGDSHGGDIDTGSEIVSATDQNIFDDVTNAERESGDTEYRKIYVRNENVDTWAAVKMWISQFTPATNDEISIKIGTNAGIQSVEGVAGGYVSPNSKTHGDVLDFGDLAQDVYKPIWIKRIVDVDGDGYTGNSFILTAESS